MKRIVALAPSLLLIAACTTTPHRPYMNEPPLPQQPPPLRPAIPPSRPTTTPTVNVPQHVQSVGPLKTAMVSGYMDQQERDIRQNLRAYGINIARRGDTFVLNINNGVLFDGWDFSTSGKNLLATLSTVLRRYDHSAVNVSGYTDTTGDADQNVKVSEKRARMVTDQLGRNGVAPARLSAQGFGEANLKIRTGDHKAEPRNRRIEIRITPMPMG